MNRIKVVKDRNYTTISNVILRDKRLSLKAKGLLVTVMGLPDTWDFTVQGIATTLKEGRDAITGAIAELIEFDYCTRVDERDADGKFIGIDYTFHEAPILSVVEPITENPITDNPPTGNPPQLSKQEELSKQREKDTVALFEFWKSTMNLNGNTFLTPKRENAIKSRLKQGYTVERIKNAIVGCSVSPHHQGRNDTKTVYNDIELICRTGEKVEFFEKKYTPPKSIGCSICENHPNRNQITIKSGGYIFNTELNQVQECVCRRTNGST